MTAPPARARLAVLAAAFLGAACASSDALVPRAPEGLPLFRDAVSLSADPTERLYVVDAAAATVTVLDADGRVLATHGGPGRGPYSFFEPADLDPTNGLALYVADDGNQRVQRFDRDFRLVRSLVIEQPADDRPTEVVQEAVPGDPIAVAASPTGDLHVLDARTRTVLTYDADRRFERRLDGLRAPVDLAVADDGTLFVADQALGGLAVFDPYGFRLRTLPLDALGGPVAVAFVRGRLLVTTTEAVAVVTPAGTVVAARRPADAVPALAGVPLVGAALAGDALFVLTERALHRVPGGFTGDR